MSIIKLGLIGKSPPGKFKDIKATRLVGNQGTVMYKESQNNTLENFVPSLDPAT